MLKHLFKLFYSTLVFRLAFMLILLDLLVNLHHYLVFSNEVIDNFLAKLLDFFINLFLE